MGALCAVALCGVSWCNVLVLRGGGGGGGGVCVCVSVSSTLSLAGFDGVTKSDGDCGRTFCVLPLLCVCEGAGECEWLCECD